MAFWCAATVAWVGSAAESAFSRRWAFLPIELAFATFSAIRAYRAIRKEEP